MNERDRSALAVIIILVIVFLIPFGLIVLTVPPETYHRVTGEPVRVAADAAGVHVINSTNTSWKEPGAKGGNTYTLQNDAGHTVTIHTQKFDSQETRDAAVRKFYSFTVGKIRPVWHLEIIGDHIILIGPDSGGILKNISAELKKQQIPR
jgi:hypothetical protein